MVDLNNFAIYAQANPITEIIRACVKLTKLDNPQLKHLTEEIGALQAALESVLFHLAFPYSKNGNGWHVDADNAGYIVINVNSLNGVRIPVNLISDFPEMEVLDELCTLANIVKRSTGSVICISGSACFWKAFGVGADIDFCEYVSRDDSSLLEGLRGAAQVAYLPPTMPITLAYKIKTAGRIRHTKIVRSLRWYRGTGDSIEPLLKWIKYYPIFDNISFDSVSITSHLGALEVTNRILVIDPKHPDSKAGLDSSPQQEALLSGNWIPRKPSSPIIIGMYVRRLVNEINGLSNQNSSYLFAIKAVGGELNQFMRFFGSYPIHLI